MITRWRYEAEGENREDVEESIEKAIMHMLSYLRVVQPDDEWECTDEFFGPVENGGGEAVFQGRRVFRVMEPLHG